MATQSPPPNPVDDNPSTNLAPQPVQATVNEAQATGNEGQATAEPPKDVSPKSVFVNSEPIREDQVQNAVNFLSHPRVRGSPVVYRRNFLEKKGLTKEEIDEAFRRVPDPSPAVTSGQTSTYQGAQATTSSNIQTQAPVQAMQPVTTAPSGVVSTMRRRFHWSHAVLAIGFLAISGAGTAVMFKKTLIPRFKSWIRKVVLEEEDAHEQKTTGKPTAIEEAAAAAKAAAAAAADVAKASQEMVIAKNEENKFFAELMKSMNLQVQEIRTMRSAISRLEGNQQAGQSYSTGRNYIREEYLDGSATRSVVNQQLMDGKSDTRSVRSASPLVSAEPPHPKSYMEIMAMVQRGERPPNFRDIDDRPPNPDQPITNPSLAPRAKPWEVGQTASNSSFGPQSQFTNEASSYMAQDNGVTYQYNNDSSSPWWQQKNARITEINNGDGPSIGSGSNGTVNVDHPVPRRWVPPQPPPISMPEAAAAIRQQKSIPKDVNIQADDMAQPVSGLEELQRITKISESGGQLPPEMNGSQYQPEMNGSQYQPEMNGGQFQPEMNGGQYQPEMNGGQFQPEMIGGSGSSGLHSSEIQEEQVTEV